MVKDRSHLNREAWTESRANLIRRAASYPEVARIFVHPPIKAELCKWAKGDRSWLAKVRPYYNHTYHFHIRMKCPPGFAGCKNQAPAAPEGWHRLRRGNGLLDGRYSLETPETRPQRQTGETGPGLDTGGPSC